MSQADVVTRFAPSPTGHLHIGGARTALFCWAYAQRARRASGNGRFLLRIEDTDQARSSADAAAGILEDLDWLSIHWDEGPVFHAAKPVGGDPRGIGPFHQSDRGAEYDAHFETLLTSGRAYYAFDTPDELNAMRKAAEAEKRTFIYRKDRCYNHTEAAERAKTEPHVLRFVMPPEAITVHDAVLGDVTFPHDELDDFVIRKADGFPTYHLAVVVDDALMGVTHVLRGQEHLNNSPKHAALFRALGYAEPVFAHMPLIFNLDNTKMSKRDKDKAAKKAVRDAKMTGFEGVPEAEFSAWLKDKSRQLSRDQVGAIAAALNLPLPEIDVEDFRAAGYLPGVLLNFLALLGWNPGGDVERFDLAFLAEHFSLDRIGKSNARFDREKLLSFNADTIQHHTSDADFASMWLAWAERFDTDLAAWAAEDAERWAIAALAAKPRARTLRDARDAINFAMIGDDAFAYDDKAVNKFLLKGEPTGIETLGHLRAVLAEVSVWQPEVIDAAIAGFVESESLGMGKVAQPLRIALTGTAVSPPLGDSLALLTKDAVLGRIDRCLGVHRG